MEAETDKVRSVWGPRDIATQSSNHGRLLEEVSSAPVSQH